MIVRRIVKESIEEDMLEFLKDKPFINKRSKRFLYHGTNINPKDFILSDNKD